MHSTSNISPGWHRKSCWKSWRSSRSQPEEQQLQLVPRQRRRWCLLLRMGRRRRRPCGWSVRNGCAGRNRFRIRCSGRAAVAGARAGIATTPPSHHHHKRSHSRSRRNRRNRTSIYSRPCLDRYWGLRKRRVARSEWVTMLRSGGRSLRHPDTHNNNQQPKTMRQ